MVSGNQGLQLLCHEVDVQALEVEDSLARQVSLISYHLATLSWLNDVAMSDVSTSVNSMNGANTVLNGCI